MNQYPAGWNPPNRGTCKVCGCPTKAYAVQWLSRCQEHWQALLRMKGIPQ